MARRKAERPADMRIWEVLTENQHGHQTMVAVEAISRDEALAGVANADRSVTVLDATPVD